MCMAMPGFLLYFRAKLRMRIDLILLLLFCRRYSLYRRRRSIHATAMALLLLLAASPVQGVGLHSNGGPWRGVRLSRSQQFLGPPIFTATQNR